MTAAGQFLIYVTAFLLPWWNYADLPQYLVFPLLMVELALAALFVIDWARRGLRAPFEYFFPLAVLAGVVSFGYANRLLELPADLREPLQPVYFLSAAMYPLAGLAVVHFTRTRAVALAALDVLALSAGAWSIAMLAGRFTGLFATPGSMGIDEWPLPNVAVYGFAAAVFAAARRDAGTGSRRVFVGVAMAAGIAFLVLGLRALDVPHFVFSGLSLSRAAALRWLAIRLAVFWPVARMAAKIVVERREPGRSRDGAYMLALVGLCALGLARYSGGYTAEFFVIALAGAWALPERAAEGYKPDWRLRAAIGVICVLVAFNLAVVNIHNPRDPRNYAPSPLFKKDARFREDARIARVEARLPMETQTNYWLAWHDLLDGNLYEAAMEYRETFWTQTDRHGRPVKTVLPHPSDDQRREFMDALRDRTSAVPPDQHRGAYVAALVGEQRLDEAIELMRGDAERAGEVPEVAESGRGVLATVVGLYVDDARIAPRLSDWTARELLALLAAWGARLEMAPAGVARNYALPVAVVARAGICEAWPPELVSGDGVEAVCVGDGAMAVGGRGVEALGGGAPLRGSDGAMCVVVRLESE